MAKNNQEWLDARPDIASLRLAAVDLNGVARGKRIPASRAAKAFSGGLRMPLSALNVDIWGEDIADSPLVFATGDVDGKLLPTERGLVPMDWFATPSALLPLWMFNEDGTAFAGDPRHALSRVVEGFAAKGLTPVVATEMEFYLLDGKSPTPKPPLSPLTGQELTSMDVLSLAGIDEFDQFFTDLYAACEVMGIPADAAISEGGLGQFEINILHSNNALKAADDAWLFKLAVKGIARKHRMAASFTAKPYEDQPGNGMHTHFSLLDDKGRNIFDDGSDKGSEALLHVVAGVLAAMPASTLIFAPHGISYQRLTPNSHAPTTPAWGYENRTVAVRIPGGSPTARRIEHRVAGGDVNPYLMLAAVLGAALNGLEDGKAPPPPTTGNAYAKDTQPLPDTWSKALEVFDGDAQIARIFHADLIDNFLRCKRQEMRRLNEADAEFETRTYLETV